MSQGGATPAPTTVASTPNKGGTSGVPNGAKPYNPSVTSPNVFGQSASALTNATNATTSGLNYQPMMLNPASYNVDSRGYDPIQLAGKNLSAYTNPWENTVVKQSLNDLEKQRLMEERQVQAQATSQGAFGGSRQALMNTENTRNYADQAARTAAGLRQAGYQNAQQMALTDIAARNRQREFQAGAYNTAAANSAGNRLQAGTANQNAFQNGANYRLNAANQLGSLSNLGFGQGTQVQQTSAQTGANQRAVMQAIIDAAKGQGTAYGEQPYKDLNTMSGVISGTPTPQSSTAEKTPGLMDYATTALATYGMYLAATSDARLKDNIEHIGYYECGLKKYRWTWNDTAIQLGVDTDPTEGVMAHEARVMFPDDVYEAPDGYLRVNYRSIN